MIFFDGSGPAFWLCVGFLALIFLMGGISWVIAWSREHFDPFKPEHKTIDALRELARAEAEER